MAHSTTSPEGIGIEYRNTRAYMTTCFNSHTLISVEESQHRLQLCEALTHVSVIISHNVSIEVAVVMTIDPPLHAACRRGDAETVDELISQGNNVRKDNSSPHILSRGTHRHRSAVN